MQELGRNEALALCSPLPFVLVTVVDDRGRPNAIGVSRFTISSWDPWLFVIAVAPRRYSHRCVEQSGELVINYPSEELAEIAWKCATHSGARLDKFTEYGIEALPALKVAAPRIQGATACFECKVVDRFTTGDHSLFVGEVIAVSGDPQRPRHLYWIHDEKLVSLDHAGDSNFEVPFR